MFNFIIQHLYPLIMCEYIILSCLNTRKTIKFYVVCAMCQNVCACLFSLDKDWFWNTRCKPYHVLLLHTRFLLQVSGKKKSSQWEPSVCCFYIRFSPCHFIREFSKARSVQLGWDKAAHLYSLGMYLRKSQV